MPRKTVPVGFVLEKANTMLASIDLSADHIADRLTLDVGVPVTKREITIANRTAREAVATFLEAILHETDTYSGFRFTDGQLGNFDETERLYFVHRSLQR